MAVVTHLHGGSKITGSYIWTSLNLHAFLKWGQAALACGLPQTTKRAKTPEPPNQPNGATSFPDEQQKQTPPQL